MGGESLKEFFDRKDKGVFVMCRNSNSGSGEFQDLYIDGTPLYLYVARAFSTKWNDAGNCGLVVGATYPDEIARVRSEVHTMPLLIPGVGAQGGDLEASVRHGMDESGTGFIISTSRAIVYTTIDDDYASVMNSKAQELDSAIRAAAVR